MNYFLSDLHGADRAYFSMKEKISFKKNDTLYILGDIFDGNDKDPAACLRILDDIMKNDNIVLILGDHEYAHVMYHIMDGNSEEQEDWENKILTDSIRGKRLHMHMLNHLSDKERDRYIGYLLEQDVSKSIMIGKQNFYLVHGAPYFNNGDIGRWQQNIVMTGIDFSVNYAQAIMSDPEYNRENNGKDIIICGHTPTRFLFPENQLDPTKEQYQRVIFCNGKMAIDCGCSGNTIGKAVDGWISDLCCVGIDAAGFFVVHLLGE